MSKQGYLVKAVSSPGVMLSDVAAYEGVATKGIPLTRKITPVTDIFSLIKLVSYLKKERPHIVHTHTPKAGLLGMIAAKICGVPIRLHTVAGLPLLEAKGVKRKLLEITEWITYACAIKVYPNSHVMKNIIIESNLCNKTKLKVIGNGSTNGIDTSLFDPALFDSTLKVSLKSKIGINEREKVLCFIGRVVVDKGIRELISSFTKTVTKYPDLKLILVGPFERELDPLDKQTEETILSHPNIVFLDYQDDVRPYLAISDLFVFPSYREGFPNVVMQAGAMGVPAIVSDINGCNEIIVHGENGLIVPAKNSKILGEAMEYLLGNEDVLDRMSAKSRKMIVERYDQMYVWNEILKEYQSFYTNTIVQNYSYV